MSDTMNSTLAPAQSVGYGDLNASQLASARQSWVSRGLDPAAFDAATGQTPGAIPTAPTLPVETMTGANLPELSAAQASAMADKLLDAGVSPERIRAALALDGFELAPVLDDKASAEREAQTEVQQQYDREFGFDRIYEPSEYHIDYSAALSHAPNGISEQSLVALNQAATEFLSELQLRPDVGASLVERAMEVGQHVRSLSPEARQAWMQQQQEVSRRQAGSEQAYQARLKMARDVLTNVEAPEFRDMIANGAAIHDPLILALLAGHQERLEAWRAELARTGR